MDPLSLLLIEDSPADAHMLWKELQISSGEQYERVWAQRLAEGLQTLQDTPVDVILLDMSLPDGSGLDCLRQVQEQAPYVPVVVMTTFADEDLALAAMQAGAQAYLIKSQVNGKMLVRVVRYAVEHKRTQVSLVRRASELQALYETVLEINANVDLPSLLQSIVERAVRLVEARIGALYLLQPDGVTLRLEYAHNFPEDTREKTLRLGEGMTGQAALTGQTLTVEDYRRGDGRTGSLEPRTFRRILAVPLKVGGSVIGVISVIDDRRAGNFTYEETRLVSLFADQAAIALHNARLYEQVQQMATMDELTSLYNRRGFFIVAERIFKLAQRSPSELVLIFIDVDRMKKINDELGHAFGDQALTEASTALRNTFRAADVLARIGGDEFAVLAYPSAESNVPQMLDRLQREVDRINAAPMRKFPLSLSAGCASWNPAHPTAMENLLAQADQAMYQVKRERRARDPEKL
jgi:diguanylate cyclase (GGDEF)-like protein